MNDFRNQLSDFAEQIEITEGSASSAAAKARRRTRASVAARVGVVAVVAAAGVVGVQALSAPGLEGEPIDAPNGVASADSTTPGGSTAPADPTATAPPLAGSVPNGSPTDDWLASAPQTRPAEYVDLDYTWTAYPADSPEALALRFNTTEQYALGTADGGSDERPFSEALYERTTEGWELVEMLDDNRYVSGSAVVGDTMYLLFSDTPTTEDSFEVRAFDFSTRAWKDVEVPEGAKPTLPEGSALERHTFASIAARDDALILLTMTGYGVSTEKLGLGDVDVSYDHETGSISIAEYSCIEEAEGNGPFTSAPTSTTPPGEPVDSAVPGTNAPTVPIATTVPPTATTPAAAATSAAPVPTTASPAPTALPTGSAPATTEVVGGIPASPSPDKFDPIGACYRTVSDEELGISEADRALLGSASSSLWTFDGSAWAQHELPGTAEDHYSLYAGGVVAVAREIYYPEADAYLQGPFTYYETRSDGTLAPLFDGHQFAGSWWAESGPPSAVGQTVAASGPYVLKQDLAAGHWTATDLNTLGEQTGWARYDVEAYPDWAGPDGSLIATGSVEVDLPEETTELTSGRYTLRFPTSLDNDTTLIDNSTGEEVHDVYLSTESGRITMVKSSEASGSDEVLAEFDTDWTSIPYLNIEIESALFVSDDGVHFGTIDGPRLAEAADVPVNDDERLHIEGAEQRDDQVILRVSVSGPDTADAYFVIVGTPN